MATSAAAPSVALPPRVYSPFAGLLSYLIPGLGQIYQGRVAKGVLFFVCLYALFFYGLALGKWQNVYLQPEGDQPRDQRPLQMLLDRARFLGQMWIGVAAWPAVVQWQTYNTNQGEHPLLGKFQRMPTTEELNAMQRNLDKTFELGWMYTVVAGVLNILVIYDAFAGPAFQAVRPRPAAPGAESEEADR
jgi:hypothetical protein